MTRFRNCSGLFPIRTAHAAFHILFLLLAVLASCSKGDHSGKVETITIAVPSLEQNALLYVADQKKFFANHGLNIAIRDYDSGVTAIKGMLKGEADLAGAAEFPLIGAVVEKEQIRVIACNDKFENDYIVGRKDRVPASMPTGIWSVLPAGPKNTLTFWDGL